MTCWHAPLIQIAPPPEYVAYVVVPQNTWSAAHKLAAATRPCGSDRKGSNTACWRPGIRAIDTTTEPTRCTEPTALTPSLFLAAWNVRFATVGIDVAPHQQALAPAFVADHRVLPAFQAGRLTRCRRIR